MLKFLLISIYFIAMKAHSMVLYIEKPDYLSHVLIANKAKGELSVKSLVDDIVYTIPMATGKNIEDKMIEGDYKTPEGVYQVQQFLNEKYLKSNYTEYKIYGTGAFTLNYPNALDSILKKSGSGIWIHGTDDEARIEKKFDSRGCFVLQNKEVIKLKDKIKSAILVSIPDDSMQLEEKEISELKLFLNNWKNDWKQNSERYASYYSEQFKNEKFLNKTEFIRYKNSNVKNNKIQEIQIEQLIIVKHKHYYYVSFIQRFNSQKLSDVGVKTMWIDGQIGNLKILYESWNPFNKQ